MSNGNQEKREDAPCPSCRNKCAEFQQMGGPKQWECLHCSAGGHILPREQASQRAEPKVHKHWSAR